jgi:hypothetical protein
MDPDIIDGTWDPSEGAMARVRVLRYDDGRMTVDYPGKDAPLKINRKDGELFEIPESAGTYEIHGEVTNIMYPVTTEETVVHSVTLKDPEVQKVSDDVEPLPRDTNDPDWETMSAEDVDIEIDEEEVPSEIVERQVGNSLRRHSDINEE